MLVYLAGQKRAVKIRTWKKTSKGGELPRNLMICACAETPSFYLPVMGGKKNREYSFILIGFKGINHDNQTTR
jgi:hypothetical protein